MSGMSGITNRERIMQEMAVMSDQDLHKLLTDHGDHGVRLTDRLCYACEERHGGKCPLVDDCLLGDGSWLRDEWDGKPLLEVDGNG